MRSAVVTLVLSASLVGCGTARIADRAPTHSTMSDPAGSPVGADRSLTVTTSLRQAPGGAMYFEGAMAEIRLLDAQGSLLASRTVMPGKPARFGNLLPGVYRLAPALRPCDGNCGYLDGRTDGCQASFHLVDSMEADVAFRISRPCRVSV